jgi:CheY-like chemotaxis protein
MGLGLSIVKRTARLLGHPLALQSTVGRGSVFSILVPIAASGFAVAAPRSSADHRALSIAIVDDDPVALDALHDLLVLWGHKVWTGGSAEAVVSAMGDETPDLLVTDYHLGASRTGAEAAATIRAHVGAWLPVIILTGDAPAAVLQDAGVNDPILSKPVDAHGLRQVIASSIG